MKQWLILCLSFVIIAFGVSIQVSVSYVGMEPWTAFHESLALRWLTIGGWTVIIQAIFLIATYIGNRKMPQVGTFINMVMIGPLVDLFLWLDFQPYTGTLFIDIMFFLLGVIVACFGSALAIHSDKGVGSKTMFYVMLHEIYKWRLRRAKFLVEAIGFTGAVLLGGNILIGTILFLWLSPILIERFLLRIRIWDKRFLQPTH